MGEMADWIIDRMVLNTPYNYGPFKCSYCGKENLYVDFCEKTNRRRLFEDEKPYECVEYWEKQFESFVEPE